MGTIVVIQTNACLVLNMRYSLYIRRLFMAMDTYISMAINFETWKSDYPVITILEQIIYFMNDGILSWKHSCMWRDECRRVISTCFFIPLYLKKHSCVWRDECERVISTCFFIPLSLKNIVVCGEMNVNGSYLHASLSLYLLKHSCVWRDECKRVISACFFIPFIS